MEENIDKKVIKRGGWLGRQDSNPRMHGPKPCVLPLDDAPPSSTQKRILNFLIKTVPPWWHLGHHQNRCCWSAGVSHRFPPSELLNDKLR